MRMSQNNKYKIKRDLYRISLIHDKLDSAYII